MISFKVEGLDEVIKEFRDQPRVIGQAMTRTLNELGKKARTATQKAITDKYTIKPTDMKENSTGHSRIKLALAQRDKDRVVMTIAGRPISLAYFNAKQASGNRVITAKKGYTLKRKAKTQGVTVQIMKGGKRTVLPHAFIQAVGAGKSGLFHTGVFQRYGRSRLPIMEKKVITLASMFKRSDAEQRIGRVVDEFEVIMVRNLEWYESRRR